VTSVIVDTGPLVAFLNGRDRHHQWVTGVLEGIAPPLITCEAVLSEACFLLQDVRGGSDAVLELVSRGIVKSTFRLDGELDEVRRLVTKYSSVPMSLADACLVRMTELERDAVVLTVDSDFRIYRRHRRQTVPTIMPLRRSGT
jgi:predicted nucleic acid-binding protein